MTDTPSRRPGLRDELVAALGQIDTVPPVAHRRAQADNVLALLYREWPWLRAEAEDHRTTGPKPASTDGLRRRIAAAIHRYDNHHALSGNDNPGKHHYGEADFVLAELRAELGALAEYENTITWMTTCTSCARILDSCIRETERAERAEAEVRRYAEAESADAAAGSYAGRAETAEAFIAFVADTIADHEGDEWADHSATRAIRAAITRAVEPTEPAATQATNDPELTAQEARDLADELGTELYRAQDRLAFIAECCDAAEQDGTTTVDISRVRGWLDGPKCGMQLAAAEPGLYDKLTAMFSGPLPPPGDTPPSTVLGCSLNQLRRTHEPHLWQPQPGMRHVQCPGWEHVPAAADTPLAAAFRDCLDTFHGMRNSDGTGPVERWQARVTPREYETWQTAAQAAGQATAGVHVYLSTGCWHGDHDYCKSMTGLNGAKRPGECKKCAAKCICGCHGGPNPT